MINSFPKYSLLIFLLMISYVSAKSQSIDDLTNRRKNIEDNISKISSLIEETSKEKSLTVNNLKLIESRIKLKKIGRAHV